MDLKKYEEGAGSKISLFLRLCAFSNFFFVYFFFSKQNDYFFLPHKKRWLYYFRNFNTIDGDPTFDF